MPANKRQPRKNLRQERLSTKAVRREKPTPPTLRRGKRANTVGAAEADTPSYPTILHLRDKFTPHQEP